VYDVKTGRFNFYLPRWLEREDSSLCEVNLRNIKLRDDVIIHIQRNIFEAWHAVTGKPLCCREFPQYCEIVDMTFIDATTFRICYDQAFGIEDDCDLQEVVLKMDPPKPEPIEGLSS
jgi:hypothetical protein